MAGGAHLHDRQPMPQPAVTTIRYMYRWGGQYRVVTACGHSFQVTKEELAARQLYEGKQIPCATCSAT